MNGEYGGGVASRGGHIGRVAPHEPLRGVHVLSREFVLLFLPVIALGLAGLAPWASLRLPGNDVSHVSLLSLAGGRFLYLLAMLLMIVGLGISLLSRRVGAVSMAIGVGLFGWFSGLVMLVIGVARGLIPNVSAFGIDVSDGLLGQGPAVVLALAASIVLSAQLIKNSYASSLAQSRLTYFGAFGLVLLTLLASANHSKWLLVDSEALGAGMGISGDSLFGSVVIGGFTWLAGSLVVGYMMGVPRIGQRAVAALLLGVSALKLLQVIVLWAGSGVVTWALPDDVGSVANVSLSAGFWVSAIASVLTLGLAVYGLLAVSTKTQKTFSPVWAYVPGIGVFLVSVLLLAAPSVANSTSGIASSSKRDSGVDYSLSTAYVSLESADDWCAAGSGAFVGDGTFVLTNQHVIDTTGLPSSCDSLFVGFGNDPTDEPDSWFPARVIWESATDDLALLKVDGLETGRTQPLEPRYERLPIGEEIRVVGFPGIGGDTLTLTQGVISGLTRDPSEFYKVSAALNPGNSGGPVLDTKGRLIGIATAGRGAEVICDGSSECYTGGTSLGFVRPIDFAEDALGEYTR